MNNQKIIGAILIILPLTAIFIFVALNVGIRSALCMFGIIAATNLLAILLCVGCFLVLTS